MEHSEYKSNDFYFLYLKKLSKEGLTGEKWHEHSFYEILFFLDGESEYAIENRLYVLKKGDVLLVKPGCHHYKRSVTKAESTIYCLGFLPNAIDCSGLAETIFEKGEYFSPGIDSPIFELMSVLKTKLVLSHSNATAFIKKIAEAVILVLNDHDLKENENTEVKNRPVQRMIDYIKEHLSSVHKVSDVADALFFSESYTRTLFKKIMGIGIMEYVKNKKVLLAHRMIRHGRKPTEVFSECGFSNYQTFYRAYLDYFGHSPKNHPYMN